MVRFGIDNGRPYYTVQYDTKDVIKKSFLGLELAKDKHASKGMKETSLMDGFELNADDKDIARRHLETCLGRKPMRYATTITR